MVEATGSLPANLRRTLTWDQGREMRNHALTSVALIKPGTRQKSRGHHGRMSGYLCTRRALAQEIRRGPA
jgi:hypothetical protein